jgi:hypothetical protein
VQAAIDELLQLARDTHGPTDPLVVDSLMAGVRDRWLVLFADRGRSLMVTTAPSLPTVAAASAALHHIVDVLLDNALEHGSGETRVTVDELADGLVIDVSDEGVGLADPATAFASRSTEEGPSTRSLDPSPRQKVAVCCCVGPRPHRCSASCCRRPRSDQRFERHTRYDLAAVATAINSRPRKTLDWKTPPKH